MNFDIPNLEDVKDEEDVKDLIEYVVDKIKDNIDSELQIAKMCSAQTECGLEMALDCVDEAVNEFWSSLVPLDVELNEIASGIKTHNKDEYDIWHVYRVELDGDDVGLNICISYGFITGCCGFGERKIRPDELESLKSYVDEEFVDYMIKCGFKSVLITKIEGTTPDIYYNCDDVSSDGLFEYIFKHIKGFGYKEGIVKNGVMIKFEDYFNQNKQ